MINLNHIKVMRCGDNAGDGHIETHKNGICIDGVNAGKSQTFTYDALDHLATAAGGYGSIAYTYDASGNMLTRASTTGSQSVSEAFTYAAGSNRLVSIATNGGLSQRQFTYSPTGNIVGDNAPLGNVLSYNQENRLIAIGGSARPLLPLATVAADGFGHTLPTSNYSYSYDGFGQRVSKAQVAADGTVFGDRRYQYDTDGRLIEELNLSTDAEVPRIDYLYLGDRPIAMLQPATGIVGYYHADRAGTPQLVSDQQQAVAWAADYNPFGAAQITANQVPQRLRFPGQYADPESDYYYNGFRDYSPSLGRYLESDPIGLRGGINTYAYVGANPVNFIDPKGLKGIDIGPLTISDKGIKIRDPLSTINKEFGDPKGAFELRLKIALEREAYKTLLDQFNAVRFDKCTPAAEKNALAKALNALAKQYDNDIMKLNNWPGNNGLKVENEYLPYPGYSPVPGQNAPVANFKD